MISIFSIAIGRWNKSLGKIINMALKNDKLSAKLKSVLLFYFVDAFYLPKESEYMQQFGIT
jgi:hypothetical protein